MRTNDRSSLLYRQICFYIAVSIVVTALALLTPSTPHAGAPPILTPTPGPTRPPRRDYDPPAPPEQLSSSDASPVNAAEVGGYPRLVKLWGGGDEREIGFYAHYDMIVNATAFTKTQISYLHSLNPNLIMLYSGTGTYDTDDGPLGSQWVNASPGTWQYDCFLRGANGQILRVYEWGHGMFNMSDNDCTDAIVDHLVSQFDPDVYDGVFFDRINERITVIINGIDLDHNGTVDDADWVDRLYYTGTQRFLNQVRTRLGALLGHETIIVGNDAPLPYTPQLNGREYELNVRDILDANKDWMWFRYNYEQWMQASRQPGLTMVMSNPPTWFRAKYGLRPYVKIRGAMREQIAAYYQRMRFGLTTALLEGGTYSFEFGDTWHGNAWWYDEFDGAGLGKGYLGQPLGEAYPAAGPLMTPNLLLNPGFEAPWPASWTLQTTGGAQATLHTAPVTATTLSPVAARITITTAAQADNVRLEQANLTLIKGQAYTMSFWGKAPRAHWRANVKLHAPGGLGALYGLDDYVELGTTWQQYWLPFTASSTAVDAILTIGVGNAWGGDVWIDEVNLQEGVLPPLFRRDFEHGIVLCNADRSPQTIDLTGEGLRKIDGKQAPLVQILIDDAEQSSDTFIKYGGWGGQTAGHDEWGSTYHYALTTGNPDGFLSKAVWRPTISHAGDYTVSIWLAPHENCTATVTYTVQYHGGSASMAVNPVVTEPTWAVLGSYPFAEGAHNAVTLTNYTQSSWVVADVVKFESAARYNDGAEVTAVTLAGQDGIILLGEPAIKKVDFDKSANRPSVQPGEVVTFTLVFGLTGTQTQTMQARMIDPNPAPAFLDILTRTIAGGAVYSPAIDAVVWEGELGVGTAPMSVTFGVRVAGAPSIWDRFVVNQAAVRDLAQPGGAPVATAFTSVRIISNIILEPRAFLPTVQKK